MDQQAMIDDLVRMLDAGAQEGVGHINVAIDASRPGGQEGTDRMPGMLGRTAGLQRSPPSTRVFDRTENE